MALETVEIKDVEVFASGLHNGQRYTDADLDEMVRAFQALRNSGRGGYSPPIKLDHAEDQPMLDDTPPDGGPAFGWVDNLRRIGSKLVADFKAVPAKLKELIDAGAYRGRSAEIWWDLEVNGKKYPRVLKAVALLGVAMPAVRSLADITKLYGGEHAFAQDEKGKYHVALFEMTIAAVLLPKTEVNYRKEEKAGDRCATCRWFTQWGEMYNPTGACSLVEGDIDPLAVCDRFEGRPVTEEYKQSGIMARMQQLMDGVKELMGMMPKGEEFADVIEGSWDGAAAARRIRAWATSDGEINFSKYRRAFAVVDGPEDNVGSYKFPHHDIQDGQLVLHSGGVRAALAAAGGARSGQANPAAQRHMAMHKEAMGMQEDIEEGKVDGVTVEQLAEMKAGFEAKFAEQAGQIATLTQENKALGEANAALNKRQMERWASDTVREWPGDIEGNRKRLLTFAEKFGQDSAEVREYITHEDASAKAIKESGLFGEVGSSQRGSLDVSDEMEAAIKLHTDAGKSRVEAIRLVAQAQPRLYAEHAKAVRE